MGLLNMFRKQPKTIIYRRRSGGNNALNKASANAALYNVHLASTKARQALRNANLRKEANMKAARNRQRRRYALVANYKGLSNNQRNLLGKNAAIRNLLRVNVVPNRSINFNRIVKMINNAKMQKVTLTRSVSRPRYQVTLPRPVRI